MTKKKMREKRRRPMVVVVRSRVQTLIRTFKPPWLGDIFLNFTFKFKNINNVYNYTQPLNKT